MLLSSQCDEWVEPDMWAYLEAAPPPEEAVGRRFSVGRTELELVRPETVTTRNLYSLVKKALLPRDTTVQPLGHSSCLVLSGHSCFFVGFFRFSSILMFRFCIETIGIVLNRQWHEILALGVLP
jgi:hypothetical protein